MYIYCRREREDRVEIFGLAIQTRYFPWVWVVVSKISGYQIIKIIAGYTIGHLYDYLKYIMPETFGYNVLKTPQILNWVVEVMKNRPPQQAEEVFFSEISFFNWLFYFINILSFSKRIVRIQNFKHIEYILPYLPIILIG